LVELEQKHDQELSIAFGDRKLLPFLDQQKA
jgi:hypothetical protein